MEVDNLERGVIFERGDLHNPSSVELHQRLIVHLAHPKINFHEVLLHLQPHAVQIAVDLGLGSNQPQQDVLPQPVAFAFFKSQDEGAAVVVGWVLPDRLDSFFEEVDVGPDGKIGGSFEVLVVGPELFYCGDVGDGEEAVFEAVLALDEVLVPEGEFVVQSLWLTFLHYIHQIIMRRPRI